MQSALDALPAAEPSFSQKSVSGRTGPALEMFPSANPTGPNYRRNCGCENRRAKHVLLREETGLVVSYIFRVETRLASYIFFQLISRDQTLY